MRRPRPDSGQSLRRVAGWILAWIAVIPLGACGGDDDGTREFRIGLLTHTEGVYADYSGFPTRDGARLAADALNEAGGLEIGGERYKVRLVVAEHGDLLEGVTLAARHLINRERVHVLVGPQLSRHAIPVARIAEHARIPMISPMSSNPETTRGRSWVFRLAFLDAAQGSALARIAHDEVSTDRAGIIIDVTSPYSRDLAESFEGAFRSLGGSVRVERVAGSSSQDDTLDMRAALGRLAAADVGVVLLPMKMPLVSQALDQAYDMGLDVVFLGTDSWDISTASERAAAGGAFVTHQWSHELDLPLGRAFIAEYTDAFGASPRTTAALTYDAVGLMVAAAAAAGSFEANAVRDALAGLPAYHGVSGTTHFAGSGDPRRGVVISRVSTGGLTLHGVVDP